MCTLHPESQPYHAIDESNGRSLHVCATCVELGLIDPEDSSTWPTPDSYAEYTGSY